jgi:hypothetical protein
MTGAHHADILAVVEPAVGDRVDRAFLHPRRADRGKGRIALDGATRGNAGLGLGDRAEVTAAPAPARAELARLEVTGTAPAMAPLRRALAGVPLTAGDSLRMPLLGGREASLRVAALEPGGPAMIDAATELRIETTGNAAGAGIRYDDLGGLGRVVDRIREVVELPLRHRDAFAALGITPPQWRMLDGFKDKSVDNMMIGLEQAKQRELWRAIHALGIPNVGMQTAKDLSRHFKSMDALEAAQPGDLLVTKVGKKGGVSYESVISGVGIEVSESILSFFSDPNHRDWVKAMRAAGLNLAEAAAAGSVAGIAGKTFGLTGTLPTLGRDEARDMIDELMKMHARH